MAGRSRLNRFFVSEYSRTIKYFRVKVWVRIGSQSLLRQRILPDRGANYGTRFSIRSLNRFFVSEYSRTLQSLASSQSHNNVSIASSSANTPGQPPRQATENIISEPPLSATLDFPVPRRRQNRRPPRRKQPKLPQNQQVRNLPFPAAHFLHHAKSRRINPLAAKRSQNPAPNTGRQIGRAHV